MLDRLVGRSRKVEGSFHRFLKQAAFDELQEEGYDLYVEPAEPPLERIAWSLYRPDLLGLASGKTILSLVLVECETNPDTTRMMGKTSKIRRSFTVQRRLGERHLLRLLLVIPPGTLHRVSNRRVRRLWEIWIVDGTGGVTYKIPQLES